MRWQKEGGGANGTIFDVPNVKSMKIKASDRKEFLNLAYALAKDAVTKNEYFDILTKLKEMCTTNLRIKWLKFWHKRHEHFVLAYH